MGGETFGMWIEGGSQGKDSCKMKDARRENWEFGGIIPRFCCERGWKCEEKKKYKIGINPKIPLEIERGEVRILESREFS